MAGIQLKTCIIFIDELDHGRSEDLQVNAEVISKPLEADGGSLARQKPVNGERTWKIRKERNWDLKAIIWWRQNDVNYIETPLHKTNREKPNTRFLKESYTWHFVKIIGGKDEKMRSRGLETKWKTI